MSEKDLELFQDLFNTYRRPLLRFAERKVGPDLSEDLVDETFLIAWHHIQTLQSHPMPKQWLFRTLDHKCRHEIARKSFQMEIATDIESLPVPVHMECGLLELLPEGLSKAERDILIFRFELGMEFSKIADCLGIREPAARRRLSRTVAKVRRLLTSSSCGP